MTFWPWQSAIRDDEATERLNARRFTGPASKQPLPCRIVVCPQCLTEDTQPYLRLTWMLGWISICPRHMAILVSQCSTCGATLGFPVFASKAAFMPRQCKRCNVDLACMSVRHADKRAMQVQEALLAGKRMGSVELPGIAAMDWPLAVAAMDILLGMIWSNTRRRMRERLYARINRDFGLEPQTGSGYWTHRYGSLVLLAWLFDRWPRNLHVAFGTLRTPRLPALIDKVFATDENTRTSLKEIFRSAAPKRPTNQGWWRRWLDELPQTGQQLRDRAGQERYDYRRMRLFVFAQLREGCSVKTVAAAANLQEKTIYLWLHCAASQGLEAALERTRGRQQLTSAQAAQLAQWLADCSDPHKPGFQRLRSQHVINEARRRFGISITKTMACRLMRMHHYRRGYRRPLYRLREDNQSGE
jgi:transposase